jgi:PAS domain-containing protein
VIKQGVCAMKKSQVHLIDEEVDFPANEQLVSTTDLQGVITYANDAFVDMSGFDREEIRHGKIKIGRPHFGYNLSINCVL